MFENARIKLTAWYLLIIMAVSASFSVILYQGTMREVERFARIQQLRFERQLADEIFLNPDMTIPEIIIRDKNLVDVIKKRIIINLLSINGIILIISGLLGYMLAGKTLHPIEEMVDEQNRFISDASHELRTPLTSLRTAMEVHLRDKNASLSEANEIICESIQEVDRLQSLTEGLLLISRYENNKMCKKCEFVDVAEILRGAVKKLEPLIRAKKHRIDMNPVSGYIQAEPSSLTNLFMIFIDNAIKYSPDGSYILCSVEKQRGDKISVVIRDEGIGISKKDIPHIFDRFYRADEARTVTGVGGTD